MWPASDEDALERAAARVADWPRLIEQARDEGVLGLLAARLSAVQPRRVPAEVLRELSDWRSVSAQRSLRMTGQLVRVLDLLEGVGVESMPLKGPTLAQDLYGDASVRQSCDLDLLVRPADAGLARRTLLAGGFDDCSPYNHRLLPGGPRDSGEVHLRRRDGEPMVDLHWRLSVMQSPAALDTEGFFEGARAIRVLERPVRAPSLVDQLLLTTQHGARHQWRPLELRLAVALQVARLPAEAWPAVIAGARRAGLVRRAVVGIAHACAPFGVPVPPPVSLLLESDPVAPGYLRFLSGAAAGWGGEARTRHHFAVLWWKVRSEDHALVTVRHAVARSVVPGPEDWDALSLPASLDRASWLLRPWRLAAKYARRAWGG